MSISLDLKKAHLHRVHGDLLAVYTWVNDQRAMVLIPHLRKRAPWFIVEESAAWKYDDPAYMARQCMLACTVLGIEESRMNWVRVGSIINEGLPDLICMPPAPPPAFYRGSMGTVQIRADGDVIGGEEVRPEVQTGAQYG